MKRALTLAALGTALATTAFAKNDLIDTQSSQTADCIDYIGSYKQIVENCTAGLSISTATETQRHDMLWSLGFAQKELDQYAQAEATFAQMLAMRPNSTAGMNGLGWVYFDKNETARALAQFELSLQSSPTASALAGVGKTQYELGQTNLTGALQMMEAALAIDPDYGYALREKGWLLLDGDQPEAARDAFLVAIGYRTNDENARLGLARAYREMDQYEQALMQANHVIERNSNSYFGYNERALNLFYLDRFRQAIKDADRAIELGPNRSKGYTIKARALSELGQRAEAFALLEKAAVRIGPNDFLTHWHAQLLVTDEQFEQAEKLLQVTVDRGSADRYDLQLLGYLRLKLDRVDEAAVVVAQALEMAPKASYVVYLDALIMVERGAFDQAEARFHEAMALGLGDHRVGTFNKRLMRKGEFARAISIRETYNSK